MNYDYIELLVKEAKDGNEESKKKLMEEFKPFILNTCKRTFIHGYDFQDIENECYRILFRCVEIYNMNSHRFVAYATNGIKNSINYLIKHSIKYKDINGAYTHTLTPEIEQSLKSNDMNTEEILCAKCDCEHLKYALSKLNKKESELIDSIYFQGTTVKNYAKQKDLSYSTIVKRKRSILNKLFNHINITNSSDNNPKFF